MAKLMLMALAALSLVSCGNKHATSATTAETTAASDTAPFVATPQMVDENVPVPPPAVPPPKVVVVDPPSTAEAGAEPDATVPRHSGASSIAYSYKLAFELPARRIDAAQQADRAACEALGPARCQVLNSSRTGGDSDAASANLDLRIAPAAVKVFTSQLETSTAKLGGSLLENSTSGEDITRQLIDADAALKAKRTLRDRLQDLLEHHRGKLADLLDVEKSLSETQQELDTATAELAELQQRITFSALEIDYRSEHPLGSTTARPLADAVANAGQTMSGSLAVMLTLTLVTVPWLLPLALIVYAIRRWRRSRAAARRVRPPPAL